MRSVLPTHLNQSEAGPITADELSAHDLEFQDGANLDLDFFNRVGNSNTHIPALARDSLYVKFDPIVGAIVSDSRRDQLAMPPPPPPQQQTNCCEEQENAVNPASGMGQGDADQPPLRSPALDAVQQLISLTPPHGQTTPITTKTDRGSLSGGTPPSGSVKSASKTQEQLHLELTKLQEIMQKELESMKSKLDQATSRLNERDAELKVALEREAKLKKDVQERTKSKQQLSMVMEEYEKTISQLVAQKEEEKKEFELQKELLIKERDTSMQHLNNMEIAFNDVHQKYERSKTVIEGMKANEDMLKKSLTEYDEAMNSSKARYDTLKNHAVQQLDKANQELDLIRRSHKAETDKLKAMLKKAEVRVSSLEESIEQKSKENQELASICDELISKVGVSN